MKTAERLLALAVIIVTEQTCFHSLRKGSVGGIFPNSIDTTHKRYGVKGPASGYLGARAYNNLRIIRYLKGKVSIQSPRSFFNCSVCGIHCIKVHRGIFAPDVEVAQELELLASVWKISAPTSLTSRTLRV